MSDIMVKRDDVPSIRFSIRSEEGVLVSCSLSEGEVAMAAVGSEGDVIEYVGEVSGIPPHTAQIVFSCEARYSQTTITSHKAAISIIGRVGV